VARAVQLTQVTKFIEFKSGVIPSATPCNDYPFILKTLQIKSFRMKTLPTAHTQSPDLSPIS
jgi:hypothetical protein